MESTTERSPDSDWTLGGPGGEPQPGAVKDRRVEPARSEAMSATQAAIAGRIRRFCGHLTEPEFDALVSRMAMIEVKYTMRRSLLWMKANCWVLD